LCLQLVWLQLLLSRRIQLMWLRLLLVITCEWEPHLGQDPAGLRLLLLLHGLWQLNAHSWRLLWVL
jgi:hypothetical protein